MQVVKKFIGGFVVSFLLLQSSVVLATQESVVQTLYKIQAGDILLITVWKEPDMQREIQVRPDGGLSFPLVGDLFAEGKTPDQLRADLVSKLKKFIPSPAVTVSVQQTTGNRIYVIGKVLKPGEFVMVRPIDVLQALSMAGGLNAFALADEIKVLRRVTGNQTVMKFNYSDIEKGRGLEQNILLRSGDVVVVP